MDNHEPNLTTQTNTGNEWIQSGAEAVEKPSVRSLGEAALDAAKNSETDQRILDLLSRVPAEERGDLPALFAAVPESTQAKYAKTIEGALNSPDEVATRTAIRGAAFELSRSKIIMEQGLEQISFDLQIPERIHFIGYTKKDNFDAEPSKEYDSAIELDVPITRDGRPYVYETKSYPRMQLGSLPAQRNQLLKYQAAIDQGVVEGATLEVKGRIHPRILEWAAGNATVEGHAPDVEIIYDMELPSGSEYRFVLKQPRKGNGLRFRNEDGPNTPEDERVIDGIQKAILDGSIVDILSSVDIENPPEDLLPHLDNPMTIKSTRLFDEYERLRKASIFKKLTEKANEN